MAVSAWAGSRYMKKKPAVAEEHLSSSKVQREIEIAMLEQLGKDLGVKLEKKRVDFEGAIMEIDGVDRAEIVFVEVFARIGALKAGQKKKVATDALKFVALKARYPDAKFILAFADQAASDSVVGWQRAVQDHHGIERVVVKIPKKLKEKLLVIQADQKKGMEAGSR
jgi:hypothetical protein